MDWLRQLGDLDLFFGLLGGVVLVGGFVVAFWRRLVHRAGIVYSFDWRAIDKAIERAEEHVWIQQTWIPDLQRGIDGWKRALDRNPELEFRVLLLDMSLVPYRLRGRKHERIAGETDRNVALIRWLMGQYNGDQVRIAARFYSLLPFGPICIIDDYVYWGIFTAHQDALKLPAFRHKTTSRIGREIVKSFNKAWDIGVTESQPFSFVMDSDISAAPDAFGGVTASIMHIDEARRRMEGAFVPVDDPQGQSGRGVLTVLRTGETDLESVGIFAGQLNVGVNRRGETQGVAAGKEIARKVRVDAIWSSPLRRASETASFAFGDLELPVDSVDDLRDRYYGALEGRLRGGIEADFIEYRGVDFADAIFVRPPGDGESAADVAVRASQVLRGAHDLCSAGTNLVVVTHGSVAAGIHYLVTGDLETLSSESALEHGGVRHYQVSREVSPQR